MQKRAFLVLGLIAMLAYLPTLWNGYALDDFLFVVHNTDVQQGWSAIPTILTTNFSHGADGFNDGLYRPIAPVTWAIEHALTGDVPFVGHLLNVLLFGLCTAQLFLFLKDWLGVHQRLLPYAAVLIFALHPIHTEAVANIKGRDEILALLFVVLAARQMLRYHRHGGIKHLLYSACWFVCAFLSKESALTAVVTLPVLMWGTPGLITGRKKIVFSWMALGIAGVALYAWRTHVIHGMDRPLDAGLNSLLNNSIAGKNSMFDRLPSAAWLQLLYFRKMIWPVSLSHDYSYNAIPALGWTDAKAWIGLLFTGTALVLSCLGARRKGVWGTAALFYFVSLAVVGNLFMLIGATFAERFLFMPSLGFSVAAGYAILHIGRKVDMQLRDIRSVFQCAPLKAWLFSILLLSATVMTMMRCMEWKNNMSLFSADVVKQPNSARIQYNYGTECYRLAAKGDANFVRPAIQHLARAVTIYPAYLDGWSNLGLAYSLVPAHDSAIACFRQAIRIDPRYQKAHYNMGLIAFQAKDYRQALEGFLGYNKKADDAAVMHYIGLSYGYLGQVQEGLPYLLRAAELSPQNGLVMKDIGVAYGYMKEYEASLAYSRKALELTPDDRAIYANMALTYRAMGDEGNYQRYMQMSRK
ncbi:MAG: DUF1736 domain-containing protein [Flavobacteriales bacterium]|nr:DUF1736 domain-containing protein [Flavobacteriales bacterium]MCB9447919.1 DUF1736 domain-containing protein [Flavobacteriales bacterium]